MESLTIKGKRVGINVLEAKATQRCITTECQSWCCTGGVWIDSWEKEKILAQAEKVKPHLPEGRRDETRWFDGERDNHLDFPSGWGEGTAVVDDPTHPAGTTCIFLRPADRYCALQTASIANGDHPWSFKPFYCILHPLTIEHDHLHLDDANEIYHEGGHCQRPHDRETPLFVTFRAELEHVLGEDGYADLLRRVGGSL